MAPMKVVPIASKSTNCAAWSPIQAMEQLLADLKAGIFKPTKLMILGFEETPDHALRASRYYSNINPMEEVALLEGEKLRAIEEWRGTR